ncbi:hypothetical protein [Nocardiopsis suaedae]|uniref:Uncharacterized protein n=1 Tax=Nocardiopsis suaedae TaxID=3018444 RepID=A0ABT4TGE1_9ACTN|nr:hypothetical protein [Nocardiopsis suaedae]MDA2803784.1 hypothetical protein [Nocardiopsis suaedae]
MSEPLDPGAESETGEDLTAGGSTILEDAVEFLAHLARIVEADESPHDGAG